MDEGREGGREGGREEGKQKKMNETSGSTSKDTYNVNDRSSMHGWSTLLNLVSGTHKRNLLIACLEPCAEFCKR
jgi:hypothetical protein